MSWSIDCFPLHSFISWAWLPWNPTFLVSLFHLIASWCSPGSLVPSLMESSMCWWVPNSACCPNSFSEQKGHKYLSVSHNFPLGWIIDTPKCSKQSLSSNIFPFFYPLAFKPAVSGASLTGKNAISLGTKGEAMSLSTCFPFPCPQICH
jgi:hypothetical protein